MCRTTYQSLRFFRCPLRWTIGLVILVSTCVETQAEVDYQRDVLPLLSEQCFLCHGPDSASREAGLRLDLPEAATAELDSGSVAIVPGDTAASELVRRITSKDDDYRMPPVDSGKSLAPAEIETLRRWIEQGAEFQQHWAFVTPRRPSLPEVTNAQWPRNPIDFFVLARLEEQSLASSPEASREQLLRRLHFDLIGLPPSVEEIDDFLADDSGQAYRNFVDQLLRSPHYGERLAIEWLDAARFADSNGYQNDFARSMWPWRDWVIGAFNQNMPYDQFLVEQLAGDLLPSPTQSQKVATGFNRNHRTVTEAGSIQEEWRVENVVDRTETLGTAILGLTIGCARCHDHKYDPLSQREFYQLFAYFNSVDEQGVYTETRGNVAPLIQLPSESQAQRLAELSQQLQEATERRSTLEQEVAEATADWIDVLGKAAPSASPGSLVDIPLDGQWQARTDNDRRIEPADSSKIPTSIDSTIGTAADFQKQQVLEYHDLLQPNRHEAFSYSVWVKPRKGGAVISKMDNANDYRGLDLLVFADGKLAVHMVHQWPDNAFKVFSTQPIPQEVWSLIAVTYDGSSSAAGLKVYVNGFRHEVKPEVDKLSASIQTSEPFRIGSRSSDNSFDGVIREFRFFDCEFDETEIASLVEGSVSRIVNAGKLVSEGEIAKDVDVDELFSAVAADGPAKQLADLRRQIEARQTEKAKLDSEIPTVMVMRELGEPRPSYVLRRGQYDLPDEDQRVEPGVPEFLPALPADAPVNRLGLARWVIDPQNPLTARVAVNRLWQRFFGLGLVKTTENFGIQGDQPSHPELLDWLATELIQSGWDLQHLQRLIVDSATYRQDSNAEAELFQRDPDNRLLARGPRFRLPAELIRDNALAVSGLLNTTVGGDSIMPYQPEGLWEELQGGAHEDYEQVTGEDLYRRSLYVYRKRTVPHPAMGTFDAPSWEICQVRRARTNTPLQALALLNDVTYVEAARKLGERMLREGGPTAVARIAYAFRSATGRQPSSEELSVLQAGFEKYLDSFIADTNRAQQLLDHGAAPRDESFSTAELAAYTTVASVILNLDETITKN